MGGQAVATETDGGRPRYLTLDGYRFLAAMAILTFHFGYDFGLGLDRVSPAFGKLKIYTDFFFCLSGFVIAQAYAGRVGSLSECATFLWRRLARIYPLHLASLAFLVASVEGLSATGLLGPRHAIFDPSNLPQNILLLHAWGTTPDQSWNLPSWSISAEWAAYIAFPLLMATARRVPVVVTVLLALGIAVAVHAVRERLGLYHWTDATSDGAMRVLPTFLAGIAVSECLNRARTLPRVPWWAANALFLLPLPLIHLGAPEDLAIALFPVVVLLAALAERTHGPGRFGRGAWIGLGQASYALYMTHFPVAFLITHLIPTDLLAAGSPWRFAYAGAVAALCVALSTVVHARFEMPAQSWVVGLPRRFREGSHGVRADSVAPGTERSR